MKFGRALWSLGSLLINATIIIYVYMSRRAPVGDFTSRMAYIKQNWDVYGLNWRIEFVLMAMIAAGAVFFATRTRTLSWAIVSVGQVFLLVTYPIMLTGYSSASPDLTLLSYRLATEIFVFGNLVFCCGLAHLYLNDDSMAKWLRLPAVALSGLGALNFLACFFDVISWEEALLVAPVLQVLYLVNSYYGLIVPLSRARTSRRSRTALA